MLSKQHYKAIAEIIGLNHVRVYINNNGELIVNLIEIAKDLADYFAKDNPRFDRDRFLEVCGL